MTKVESSINAKLENVYFSSNTPRGRGRPRKKPQDNPPAIDATEQPCREEQHHEPSSQWDRFMKHQKSKQSYESVYVHPPTRKILCYFQEHHPQWLAQKALQKLTIHRDGTIRLASTVDPQIALYTNYDPVERRHMLYYQANPHDTALSFLLQDLKMPRVANDMQIIEKSANELITAVAEMDDFRQ